MQFNTAYNREPSPPEKNSGEVITDIAGYVPAENRIQMIMAAGVRLKDFRRGQFDFEPDEPIDEDVPCDPTRDGNFDLADGTILSQAVESRLKASQTAQEPLETVPAAPAGYKLVKDEIAPEGV